MKRRKFYPYEGTVIALTVVTNFFIIAGVTRHWIKHDYHTELAETQPQAAQVQEQAPNGASCPQAY